jgi:hypothetical protein
LWKNELLSTRLQAKKILRRCRAGTDRLYLQF